MEIAIIGAGAVGLGLTTFLARPDRPVRLFVRNDARRAQLSRAGLLRTGLFGEQRIEPDALALVSDWQSVRESPPDWLWICAKTFANDEIAEALRATGLAERSATRLLLCQNGWGNEIPFLGHWPEERLFHARVITGFHIRPGDPNAIDSPTQSGEAAPLHVEVTAHAAPIAMGSVFGCDPGSVAALVEALDTGGIPSELQADMRGVLWAKMLYNCALNPLGALAGKRYGELAEDPTSRVLIDAIVHEIFAVLAHTDHPLAWPDAAAYLETFYRDLIPPTAAHASSMLQDLQAGRRTEIESLCGAVERLGVEHGVATPVVSALATLIRSVETEALTKPIGHLVPGATT